MTYNIQSLEAKVTRFVKEKNYRKIFRHIGSGACCRCD